MFGGKAREENEQLRQQNTELQQRIGQLEYVLTSTGADDVVKVKDAHAAAIQEFEKYQHWAEVTKAAAERGVSEANSELGKLFAQVDAARRSIVDLNVQAELQSDGLFEFAHPAEASVQLGDQLASVRGQIKDAVRRKVAVTAATGFTFNNSAAQGRKFINDMSKMMLRAYNAESENAVLTVKAGNLPAATKRVEKAREQTARLGAMISLQVTTHYHQLRLLELRLAAQHLQAKQAAKEAEREERARLREEKRAQAEMEAEKRRLEKEKQHYENTIEKLRSQGRIDEVDDLVKRLAEIERGIEDVDYRAANIRAGYVYVISNLGSFGERMVKIGMTRRLEPLDRVRELSDASVPFNFDVHAMFFSEDAVGVEAELHRRFSARRVNRVNTRREFFYATPLEVKDELAAVAGSLLEFHVEPEADQFRESQRMHRARDGQVAEGTVGVAAAS